MSILVIAEHDNSELKGATLNTVAAAKKIGGDIDILVAGMDCESVADSASQIPGVSKADLTALLVWLKIKEIKKEKFNNLAKKKLSS